MSSISAALEEGLSGGRAVGKKVLCAIAIEVRGRGSGRLRLQVIEDASGESLCGFVQAATTPGAIVHTDGWQAYAPLSRLGYKHRPRVQRTAPAGEQLLDRAHRAIANLKAWMHGTDRSVSDPHLPVYLDEYVFRHNRRRTPIAAFQTLLGLGSQHSPTTYKQITKHAA